MLSKDEILDLRKPKVQPLTLPTGGGEVFLRVMTGADRAFVREAIGSANAKIRAALDAWDETFFYGYVGGRADDEAARAQAKRRASDRIISRAIDGAAS